MTGETSISERSIFMSKRFLLACAVSCAVMTVPAWALAEDIIEGAETIVEDVGDAAEEIVGGNETDDAPDLTEETEATTEVTTTTQATTTAPQTQAGTNPSTGAGLATAAATGIAAAVAVALRKRK